MDVLIPERPTFTSDALADGSNEGLLTATDGSTWIRVAFGEPTDVDEPGVVVAAETPDGQVYVWDGEALFRALFHQVEA